MLLKKKIENHFDFFQEFELCKALDENEKLIEKSLNKQSPGEVKITQEIDKLTKRLTQLSSELDKVIKNMWINFKCGNMICNVSFLDEDEKGRRGNSFTKKRTRDVRKARVGEESVGVCQEY